VTKNRGVEWGKNKEYDRQELRRNTAGQFDGDNIVRQTFAANVAFYNVIQIHHYAARKVSSRNKNNKREK